MLTIHVIREGGDRYYVEDLVPGRAEGGPVAGEEPGRWTGDGAVALGLTGTVSAPTFGAVLGGRHPITGAALRTGGGARSVAGFDLTFAAPKSVSLLHALGPAEMAGAVGEGHRAAVTDAAGYLQRDAVGVRRSRGGQIHLLPAVGPVAGGFLHRTSRALDPHLHTHLVVANVAQGVDGRWSTVDGRRIFAHARAAGSVYHARLRREITDRLGAAWVAGRSGPGDVGGVDQTLCRLFSQRSAGIDEYLARRTGPRPAGRRVAALATRPDKDVTVTVEALRDEWRRRAGDFGFDLGDLTRVVGLGRDDPLRPVVDRDRLVEQLGLLSGRRRTLAHRDVVAAVAGAALRGASSDAVEAVAARVVGATGAPCPVAGPDGGDRRCGPSTEPRWAAGDVARAVARRPGLLAPPVDRPSPVHTPVRGTGVWRDGHVTVLGR